MAFLKLCLLLTFLSTAFSTHFRGASINWRPIAADEVNGAYTIEINFRIAWRRSDTFCDQSTIDSQALIGTGSLSCISGCNHTLGYMSFYCTDYSEVKDWTAGGRTYQTTISTPEFEAKFSSCCWISTLIFGSDGGWDVLVRGNLTRREDTGQINSSPVSAMSPILRLQYGSRHVIRIPVEDADGDEVRCRWANRYLGECGDVCEAFPGSVLNERKCELRYTANGPTGYYAVAIQVEDYASPTDVSPLSSIPLQFLVNVFDSNDSSVPEFVSPTREDRSYVAIPSGTTYHERIVVEVTSSPNVSIIEVETVSPPGLRKSEVTRLSELQWYINVTWTPTQSQFGLSFIFCFKATDSTGLSTEQRCITLLPEAPPQVVEVMTTAPSQVVEVMTTAPPQVVTIYEVLTKTPSFKCNDDEFNKVKEIVMIVGITVGSILLLLILVTLIILGIAVARLVHKREKKNLQDQYPNYSPEKVLDSETNI